ncbi:MULTISPECIES: ABC transporter permease [unclassified Janthinobacterium]|uniref:ABC transporter permease n=1 Tax=unclassified Janthinobacterium TaxID=2610881 RepID=UPI00055AC2C7|nr:MULTISPECIES: ABC transporter permease [unclassified Janthinobacterium]MEC5161376.1 NitT/TauT family transport system permease protein [Janthinobacterium sp. CG_S6]
MLHRPPSAAALAAHVLPALSVAVLAFGLWQLLSSTVYQGRGYLLPAPLEVAAAVGEHAGVLASATLATLKEALFGYALAVVLGVALAALMSQSRLIERSIYPYAVLLQTVPVVAVAPLIVLWCGYNERSVVLISLIMSLFPIVNNTLLGLRSTSRNLTELFALHGASRWTVFRKLRLPAALPHTIAGLRISAGLSVVGAIVGEFIIGSGNEQGGLGVQIVFAQGRMYTALLFAEVIAATMLGFLLFATVSGAGRLLLRHRDEPSAA